MNQTELLAAVQRCNAGRDAELLAMKYEKMAESPFVFLRGACHLFYAALPEHALLHTAPLAWCCGDLHFENFGSYKGNNQQVYFDINDYDEGALAPLTWDILRLLTSLQCGAEALKVSKEEARKISMSCVMAYRDALLVGKALWVEKASAKGLVFELLDSLQKRSNQAFLDKRTVRDGRKRRFNLANGKALPIKKADKKRVETFMAEFAAQQAKPKFYRVQDIARRIAGTGSLGVSRFEVLIRGDGSPDGNQVLDLKIARPSALLPALAKLGIQQPDLGSDAQRVVKVQKAMQSYDHAGLQAVQLGDEGFLLRVLQPTEDRVEIGKGGKKISRLHEVAATMGQITAWNQLRASGRYGAANADALIAFAQDTAWMADLLALSEDMTQVTQAQWRQFKEGWKTGQLSVA